MVLGVGWEDCHSSPTRTLHPQRLTPQWQGREFGGRGCSAQAWGEEECLREGLMVVFPFHWEFKHGWSVHGARTENPATPLPKIITASTTSSLS